MADGTLDHCSLGDCTGSNYDETKVRIDLRTCQDDLLIKHIVMVKLTWTLILKLFNSF